jgi:hypothetical protein
MRNASPSTRASRGVIEDEIPKHAGCFATPYITTDADATAKNNLDNLPRC